MTYTTSALPVDSNESLCLQIVYVAFHINNQVKLYLQLKETSGAYNNYCVVQFQLKVELGVFLTVHRSRYQS